MNKLLFSDYSDGIQQNFADVNEVRTFSKLCIDTYHGRMQKYSKEEANAAIRNKIREIAGLPENFTERQYSKAMKKTVVKEAIFEIVEETTDDTLITGWTADPFFNKYVDFKTGVLGQKNTYYTKPECILTIAKIAPGHHSIERQRLAGGTTRSVSTASYGAKVYMEMERFLQGVEDWTELVDMIAVAFTRYVNTMVHAAVMSAPAALPISANWNIKGEAVATNKPKLKKLISDVQLATGSKAVIMGTETALAELTKFGDVTWAAEQAKNDIYTMGRLGSFEGTPIVEIPQAFAYNDVTSYLEDDTKLLVMPGNIDKFVKFFYEGADEIKEISEAGDNADDTKEYEFKSTFGVETMTNVRFGCYTIGA